MPQPDDLLTVAQVDPSSYRFCAGFIRFILVALSLRAIAKIVSLH